ncbi:MAG: hypothetical protein ISR65_10075 [Bacteriovoracaceae bacterium]|nr:hypothetical protein [Bacteriovoracaceae bacterium]
MPKQNKIISNQAYWLIRTNGGRLFRSFLDQKLVAIGYPELDHSSLSKVVNEQKKLMGFIEKKLPQHKVPGYIANQMKRFYLEMKKGDLVISPSAQTSSLAIGRVASDSIKSERVFKKNRKGENVLVADYSKCCDVKWLKTVPKYKINPALYNLFFSHQTIVDASKYATHINSLLFDFYRYENDYNLVLDIDAERVKAPELFSAFNQIFEIANKISADLTLEVDNDIELSINLNSPGKLVLTAKVASTLLIVGLILTSIGGGGFEFSVAGAKMKLSVPGIIKTVDNFMNNSVDREIKTELLLKIRNMDIKNSKDIVRIIDAVNKVERKI